jgi:peptidoglycan/LPS O-acetylase OafA/YrhL
VTTVAPSGLERGSGAAVSRLPSLTGLRFLAAFLVFGFHVHIMGFLADSGARTAMEWIFGSGAVGVSFFFILSGFVLTWSARPGDTAARFWRRRVAKIYPNHLVTALVAIGAASVTGSLLSLAIVVPNLLLVQAWSPDITVFFGLNTVSWSLACEVFFYALFPLLHRALVRLPARSLWLATVAALGLVWLVPVVAHLLPAADRYWAIWVFPVTRLPEFVAGMILARIVSSGRWPAMPVWPVVALAVAVYLSVRWLPGDFRLVAGTAVPLALLVAAVGAADADRRRAPLRGSGSRNRRRTPLRGGGSRDGRGTPWATRQAVWLGEISYAFYLVHQLVLRILAKEAGIGHHPLAGLGLAVVALVVAVAGSALLYYWVERPAMALIGGTRRARHSARRRVAGPGGQGFLPVATNRVARLATRRLRLARLRR